MQNEPDSQDVDARSHEVALPHVTGTLGVMTIVPEQVEQSLL